MSTASQFAEYHFDNPQIYKMFKKLTFQLIHAKRNHYGARAIFEVIRFETIISGNDNFKINNNYIARYVRLFDKDFPVYNEFFTKRQLKSDLWED